MKQSRFNQKSVEFASTKKTANNSINDALNSIFYWRKQLINLSNKNEYCDNKPVATIEKAVRNYTKGGQKWDINIFPKDYKGRFCIIAKYTDNIITINDLMYGDIVTDNKGREIIINTDNTLAILKPIPMNLKAVFNAFCSVAANEIKAIEKAEKEQICAEEKAEKDRIKAIEKAEKIKVRKINDVTKQYQLGKISTLEYNNKIADIKAA